MCSHTHSPCSCYCSSTSYSSSPFSCSSFLLPVPATPLHRSGTLHAALFLHITVIEPTPPTRYVFLVRLVHSCFLFVLLVHTGPTGNTDNKECEREIRIVGPSWWISEPCGLSDARLLSTGFMSPAWGMVTICAPSSQPRCELSGSKGFAV